MAPPVARRTNVYFSDQAFRTLEDLSAQTGLSMSEVIREALKFYRWSLEVRQQGGRIMVERGGVVRELISL